MLAQQTVLGRGALAPVARTATTASTRRPLSAMLCPMRTGRPFVAYAAASSPSLNPASSSNTRKTLAHVRIPTTAKLGGGSSKGGGGALMNAPTVIKQNTAKAKSKQKKEMKTDDGQGGGIGGKGIFNGGGGGDDGGDDDDYSFNDGEDDGDDNSGSFFRALVAENYTRAAIDIVLHEWGYTIASLPLILQTAVQMGLLSSAQLARFCAMDNRPNVTRWIARRLPIGMSRGLVGRMMADPGFPQKMLFEVAFTGIGSLGYELDQRRGNFFKEFDLVTINTLSLMAATTAVVWAVAPNRSFGPPTLPFQRAFQNLPSNVFDMSGPMRKYSLGSRFASYATKTANLALVGAAAGGFMGLAGKASTALRQKSDPTYSPRLPAPDARQAAIGLGGFMGISSNFRYQIIAGVDRYLFGHSTLLWSYLAATGFLRFTSHAVSQQSRLHFMGLPTDTPGNLYSQYISPTAASTAAATRRQVESVVRGDSEAPERFYEDASGRLRSTKKKTKKRRSPPSTERSSGERAPAYA